MMLGSKLAATLFAVGAVAVVPYAGWDDFKGLSQHNVTDQVFAPDQECSPGVWYSPDKYTCYNGELCAFLNGYPMERCGLTSPAVCYFRYRYACNNGVLSELAPMDKPYRLIGANFVMRRASFLQACGNSFYLGDDRPCTLCPSQVGEGCPAGGDTVFQGTSGMSTMVPGGQYFYIDTTGALQFTVPHSGAIPEGAITTVTALANGVFASFPYDSWMACPVDAPSDPHSEEPINRWKVYAQLANIQFNATCVPINIVTSEYDGKTPAAWEYT